MLAVLAVALTAWTALRETARRHQSPFGDFNNLHTGIECLIAGCDPYDSVALNREASARHEPKPNILATTPVYPTSSLLVLLPFEPLGWPRAAYFFNSLAGLLTAAACALLAWRLRIRAWDPAALPMLAGLVCLPMASALEFANPALLAAALIALACLPLLQTERATSGWLLLGLALALKPQLAIGAAVALLFHRATRRAAAKACALALLLLVAGILAYRVRLGSFHFLASLMAALRLSAQPGGSSDYANRDAFDFLNLQGAFATIPHLSRSAITALAWASTALLAGLAATRRAWERRPWTLIALATAISLLPVYHRGYDRVIALVLVPAAVEIARTRRGLAWLYASLVTLWIANDTIMSHILKRWHFAPQNGVEDVLFCLVLLASLRGARLDAEEVPPALVAS